MKTIKESTLRTLIRQELRKNMLLKESKNVSLDGLNYVLSISKEATTDKVLRLQFTPKTSAEYDKIMETGKDKVAKSIEVYIYNKLNINAKHSTKMDSGYGGLNFEFKIDDLLQYFK